MSTTRYASALGLGFGDCGKGHFVDALTRRWQAHTVVRFNGGAQAGHNVVISGRGKAPSRRHTFSQFGAGTLVAGVRTLLLNPMVVHPTALLVEAEALGRMGVNDALSRLMIDATCRLTTPFHQAAGRLREWLRGIDAHGTCGVGVGETVRHELEHPDQVIRYGDLAKSETAALLERLHAIRDTLLAEFLPGSTEQGSGPLAEKFYILRNESLAQKWLASARALARHCPPGSFEAIHRQLIQPGGVLFEGAQGVLLDEWRGFHPHTTWSSINTEAVNQIAGHFGIEKPIEHYGVMRAYLTRHGAGPLPTHDQSLDDLLPEPHNQGDGWQGPFRRGHPDSVLLRYALEAAGPLAGLFVSHLDVFQHGLALKWNESYSIESPLAQWPRSVERLTLAPKRDLDYQHSLTQLLQRARPKYNAKPIRSASDFLGRLGEVTSLPVRFCSYGATSNDVREQ